MAKYESSVVSLLLYLGYCGWSGEEVGWREFRNFKSRLETSCAGSASQIGWMWRRASVSRAAEINRSDRYEATLQRIKDGEHVLPEKFVYYLIPGLFSNHGPQYFMAVKEYFVNCLRLDCQIADIPSEGRVEENARLLRAAIDNLCRKTGKNVVLVGHSKGGIDAAAACSIYPYLKDKVAALVLIQCPFGGSSIASDLMRDSGIGGQKMQRALEKVVIKAIKFGQEIFVEKDTGENIFKRRNDADAELTTQEMMATVNELTHEERQKFVEKHPLPEKIPTLCCATMVDKKELSVSHIGYVKRPFGKGGYSLFFPLANVMSVLALYMEWRYGVDSDGLVATMDAEIPGSILVRPVKKVHHGSMVFESCGKNSSRVDGGQICEALISVLLAEAVGI